MVVGESKQQHKNKGNSMAKETKMAKEAAAEAGATPAPSATMLALFKPAEGIEATVAKLERRNMPTMFKPGDVPVGGIVSGEIIKIVDSPVSTIKGKLLWLRHESGREFTFPCTGVIRNALAPGVKDDGDKLDKALNAEVGKMLYCKRLDDKPSKYKKAMFMFDVFTAEKSGKK